MRPLLLALPLSLAACAPTFDYLPIGEKSAYGYADQRNEDGGHTIRVVMPIHTPDMNLVHVYWDRRAAELCGHSNYRKNIFRAERPTQYYDSYGAQPGHFILEGYAYCDPAAPAGAESSPPAAASEASPPQQPQR